MDIFKKLDELEPLAKELNELSDWCRKEAIRFACDCSRDDILEILEIKARRKKAKAERKKTKERSDR